MVALGLDASQDDPIGVLEVSEAGFAAAGGRVAKADLPIALIEEGGYLCEALPRNLSASLRASDRARG